MEENNRKAKSWFITGTDTEIGKTYVSCQILKYASAKNYRTLAMKPVASGVEADGTNLDVQSLRTASNVVAAANLINPYCFTLPIAPHLSAKEENRQIEFSKIATAYQELLPSSDILLVEGVGGLLVPLGDDGAVADLIEYLQIPLILVVGMRLGCINHALLSVELIKQRGLKFAGWIANYVDPNMLSAEDNLYTLQKMIAAPCLGIVQYQGQGDFSEIFDNLCPSNVI